VPRITVSCSELLSSAAFKILLDTLEQLVVTESVTTEERYDTPVYSTHRGWIFEIIPKAPFSDSLLKSSESDCSTQPFICHPVSAIPSDYICQAWDSEKSEDSSGSESGGPG
jgi:hypothetical protein